MSVGTVWPVLALCCVVAAHGFTKQTEVLLSSGLAETTALVGRSIGMPNGRLVRQFLGIPYAKPPIFDRRFRLPFPPEQLGPRYNATDFKPPCAQSVPPGQLNPSSEDCLYLNIWAPDDMQSSQQGYPIMVVMLGGGFQQSSVDSELFNGARLASQHEVIVVTVSYRLDVFGFLSLNNNDIPGNFGLYDQKAALEWLTSNINEFGGDRSRMTLVGSGASAATIGYLLLSNTIGNLFKWAVLHGGSPLSPWAYVHPAQAKNTAQDLLEQVGCGGGRREWEKARCLRSLESGKLLAASRRINPSGYFSYSFVPTSDGIIITEPPEALLRKGYNKKTEILVGTTDFEGTHFYDELFADVRANEGLDLSATSGTYSDAQLRYLTSLVFKDVSPILQELILFMYTKWEQPNNATARRVSFHDMIQDRYYTCPILDFAKAFSNSGSGAYLFNVPVTPGAERGAISGSKCETASKMEVDDTGIGWLFGNCGLENSKVSAEIMQAWSDFSKTGDPNIGVRYQSGGGGGRLSAAWEKWEPMRRGRMRFGGDMQSDMQAWNLADKCSFWADQLPLQVRLEDEACQEEDEAE